MLAYRPQGGHGEGTMGGGREVSRGVGWARGRGRSRETERELEVGRAGERSRGRLGVRYGR